MYKVFSTGLIIILFLYIWFTPTVKVEAPAPVETKLYHSWASSIDKSKGVSVPKTITERAPQQEPETEVVDEPVPLTNLEKNIAAMKADWARKGYDENGNPPVEIEPEPFDDGTNVRADVPHYPRPMPAYTQDEEYEEFRPRPRRRGGNFHIITPRGFNIGFGW